MNEKPKRDFDAEPTQDDRVFAAVAHGSMFIGVGIIVPFIIWYLQREKSEYVRFHALQAGLWQGMLMAAGFVLGGCMFCGFFTTGLLSSSSSNGDPGPAFFVPFCGMFVFMGVMFLAALVSLYAAITTFLGNDFRYPVVSRWAERD